MFRGFSGGWNSLTTAQKFIIGAVGAVIVYGLIAGMGGNGGLGRLTDPVLAQDASRRTGGSAA